MGKGKVSDRRIDCIDYIFSNISSKNIHHYSVGSLRVGNKLPQVSKAVYPDTQLFDVPVTESSDRKKIYSKTERENIFELINERVNKNSEEIIPYYSVT